MEILSLIFKGLNVLLSVFKLLYEVHRDKKRAATDSNSDGNATK